MPNETVSLDMYVVNSLTSRNRLFLQKNTVRFEKTTILPEI